MPPIPEEERASDRQSSSQWAVAGVAMEVAMGVAGAALAGYFLDRWLETTPWLMLAAAGLGIVAGTVTLIRLALRSKP